MEKVAVIIVNFNGVKYLPDLLGSIFNFPPKNVLQEIIIVDNFSTDNSLEYIKTNYPQVLLIASNKNLGFAGGNNLGIKYALDNNFDYVMLLNQDTIVTEDYLDSLVKKITSEKNIACVQPKILLWPARDLLNSLGTKIHYLGFGYTYGHQQPDDGKLENHCKFNYCSGAACLIKSAVLRQVGLFDENLFMYHEDLDLGWRFSLAGYKNVADYSSIVYHKYEFSRSITKIYFMERNRFIVLFKNYRLATIILILPALICMEIGLFIFSFKNGWWKEKIKAYGYLLNIVHWPRLYASRKKSQQLRRCHDYEIVKDFSGKIEHQELNSFLVAKIVNPIFNVYWQLIKKLIIW